MFDEDVHMKRLIDIKKRIRKAADKVGRDPETVRLIAVSKNHSIEKIKYFYEQGINIFGENRVQELIDKNEKIGYIDWHFVGHLQRNKVKYLMRMNSCKMIHSLDSWRLAKEIDKRAAKNGRVMPVLVEVNVAKDKNKFGIKYDETLSFIKRVRELKNIDIQGLMTVVPYVDDPEDARPYFKKMAKLKEQINDSGIEIKELSMGMTNDFEIAIEEGATMVRIGTGLFGPRDY